MLMPVRRGRHRPAGRWDHCVPMLTPWRTIASGASGWRQQVPDLVDRCGAGRCRLGALYDEMVVEELSVLVMLMKVLRRQDGRYDRHLGVELDAHKSLDDGVGDELVPVDAAIDDEPRGNDRDVAPALGEQQRVQRVSSDPGTSKKSISPSRYPCLAISAVNDIRHRSTMSLCQQA